MKEIIYLLDMYGRLLFLIIVLVISIVCFIRKTNFVWNFLSIDPEEDFFLKHAKTVNHIIYGFFFVLSLIGIVLSFPRLLDLPAVLRNDFQYDTGKVVSQDYPEENDKKNRTVTIENSSGEVKKYYIFRCPLLEEGELVTINYYERSHNGYLKIATKK